MNTSAAKTPGKRPFIAGCVTLLLFSATHMITMFVNLFVEPTKSVEVEATRAMAAVAVDMGPFHTSWLGLNRLLSGAPNREKSRLGTPVTRPCCCSSPSSTWSRCRPSSRTPGCGRWPRST